MSTRVEVMADGSVRSWQVGVIEANGGKPINDELRPGDCLVIASYPVIRIEAVRVNGVEVPFENLGFDAADAAHRIKLLPTAGGRDRKKGGEK